MIIMIITIILITLLLTLFNCSFNAVDGDDSSPSLEPEHKFKFILAIVVGSLDVILFIVAVILCRGIIRRSRRRNQPAGRRNILKQN